MNRVALTGAGCITPIGNDVTTFTENLFRGTPGFSDIEDLTAGDLHFSRVARVRDFVPSDWLTAAQLQIADRTTQFALASARQTLTQSRLMEHYRGDDVAVIFGCSAGGRMSEEPETAKLYAKGGRVHPLTVPRAMASAGASLVCMEHGITGPTYTVSTACASAAHAIGQAFHMVRSGVVNAAVTGGHEAPLTYGFLKGWDSLHVVSPTQCKPFAADRDGLSLGEGAALFTLELMENALQRGANILAEVTGFGMSSDANHITQPSAAGAAAAMQKALRDAQIEHSQVAYVNAHGTGTARNDRTEAEALHQVFGERAEQLPVSSTKGLHGHAMGASGALEFLATALALRHGTAPASASLDHPDATLSLFGLLQRNEPISGSFALSNSFAFGGLNAVLVLRKPLESVQEETTSLLT